MEAELHAMFHHRRLRDVDPVDSRSSREQEQEFAYRLGPGVGQQHRAPALEAPLGRINIDREVHRHYMRNAALDVRLVALFAFRAPRSMVGLHRMRVEHVGVVVDPATHGGPRHNSRRANVDDPFRQAPSLPSAPIATGPRVGRQHEEHREGRPAES